MSMSRAHSEAVSSRSMSIEGFEALDVVADRWTLVVLRAVVLGVHRFGSLRRELGVSATLLSDRLKRLENTGVLERRPYRQDPVWFEYHLSQAGWELWPAIAALSHWAVRHVDGLDAGDVALGERLAALAGAQELPRVDLATRG